MKTSVEKQLSIFCNYEVLKRTGTSSNHKKIIDKKYKRMTDSRNIIYREFCFQEKLWIYSVHKHERNRIPVIITK